MTSVYIVLWGRSMRGPAGFWALAAEDIHWDRRWYRVFDDPRPPFYRWFVGARLNPCYTALDAHIDRGRGKQRALIYDSPVTGTVTTYTFDELRDRVARVAGMLQRQGVRTGDRVIIYMPMIPEAVMAMLACARIGAIHSVVFGGFAAPELAKRIDDAKPKLVISASCGLEPGKVIAYKPLVDEAIELSAAKPQTCLFLQRPQMQAALKLGRDRDWNDVMSGGRSADC